MIYEHHTEREVRMPHLAVLQSDESRMVGNDLCNSLLQQTNIIVSIVNFGNTSPARWGNQNLQQTNSTMADNHIHIKPTAWWPTTTYTSYTLQNHGKSKVWGGGRARRTATAGRGRERRPHNLLKHKTSHVTCLLKLNQSWMCISSTLDKYKPQPF